VTTSLSIKRKILIPTPYHVQASVIGLLAPGNRAWRGSSTPSPLAPGLALFCCVLKDGGNGRYEAGMARFPQ
jgi:hypothetical protein